MQPIYVAVLSMECDGDYYLEVLDRDVKVIKQVKALSSDLLRPKYRVTYIITSEEPKTIKVRYTCGDDVSEQEIALSKIMRYVVNLLIGLGVNA